MVDIRFLCYLRLYSNLFEYILFLWRLTLELWTSHHRWLLWIWSLIIIRLDHNSFYTCCSARELRHWYLLLGWCMGRWFLSMSWTYILFLLDSLVLLGLSYMEEIASPLALIRPYRKLLCNSWCPRLHKKLFLNLLLGSWLGGLDNTLFMSHLDWCSIMRMSILVLCMRCMEGWGLGHRRCSLVMILLMHRFRYRWSGLCRYLFPGLHKGCRFRFLLLLDWVRFRFLDIMFRFHRSWYFALWNDIRSLRRYWFEY